MWGRVTMRDFIWAVAFGLVYWSVLIGLLLLGEGP